MRKVLFKKWIPREWETNGPGTQKSKDGTNKWDDDFIHEGLFHQWGNGYEEFETGPGNFTVGLVELPDGTISEVLPSNIKFITDEHKDN